jgi:hypothetical protein
MVSYHGTTLGQEPNSITICAASCRNFPRSLPLFAPIIDLCIVNVNAYIGSLAA